MRRSCISRSARRSSSAGATRRPSCTTRRATRLRRLDAPFDSEQLRASQRPNPRLLRPRSSFRPRRLRRPDPGPIFIVGLPRSGSTLIEQILASHSRVEGTMELPNILSIVRQFDDMRAERDGYPETVGALPAAQFAALGRRYLEETAPLHPGREHFTDKLPNNFSHVGLIHSILPHAIIIDARRHPMDACFSTFKQHFAEGQSFSYDLEDLGRYYRCYLALMDHWDRCCPARCCISSTRHWCAIRRPISGGSSRIAGLNSSPPASASMRPRARSAPRAPSRCASPSTLRASATGGISGTARTPATRTRATALDRFQDSSLQHFSAPSPY